MTDTEALLEIRRALGCPEWTSADDVVAMVGDIAGFVLQTAVLMDVDNATLENFVPCTTRFLMQNIKETLEAEQEEVEECKVLPSLTMVKGGK